jgi:hypothetical protein
MKKHATWIVLAAVVMMLAAMFAYVASDDEALAPMPAAEKTAQ